jgi:hypothetical protein
LVTPVHTDTPLNAITTVKPLKNFFNYDLDEVNCRTKSCPVVFLLFL